MFKYIFKVKNDLNKSIIGSGSFKTSKKFNKKERLKFMREFTNNAYLNKFVSIDITEFKI